MGRLDAEGLQGKLSFRVDSADIRLTQLRGEVDVAGSSGDVEASEISGSWHSDFSSGDCEVDRLQGPLAFFRTSSGDVRVRSLVADRLSVETSSGDARFEDADVREIQTESSSGDLFIESRETASRAFARSRRAATSGLTLPDDASFHAEADQSSGDMRVGFADGERGYSREELVSFRQGRVART